LGNEKDDGILFVPTEGENKKQPTEETVSC